MALLYSLLWRLLLFLLHGRALVSWLRARLRSWKGRLWERAMATLLLPMALAGFPDHRRKSNHNPDAHGTAANGNSAPNRRHRWLNDGRSLEKLPSHIGLLVAEEEPSYTDIANLVVWCMAVGISYVSIYDNHGIFRKNNSRLLEVIVMQQQHLLGTEGSKYTVEFLSDCADEHRDNVVSCRPTVKVLSPEDGKQSIVQAAQQLCRSVENKERSSKDITVSMLDALLRESNHLPDPEMVVKFGPVDSTLGFLPWHIRLTEFIFQATNMRRHQCISSVQDGAQEAPPPPPPPPPPPRGHWPSSLAPVARETMLPVVSTAESLPRGAGTPAPGVCRRVREVLSRDLLVTLALGQVLSLLICAIGLTSKYLADDFHASTPVFQSFLSYIMLFLVYTTTLAVRQGEGNLLAILKQRWWKYMVLGLIDIEANYLILKAYQYTTLPSVQLLDCFVIPVVLLLSWFFLLVRYKAVHIAGTVLCLLGLGCTVGADVLLGRQQSLGEQKLFGDLLVLGGATLYGISNVCEEFIVKNLSRVEFLGMMGLFGSFFSGIQLAIMEHKELLKVPWDWQIGLLYVGFSAFTFSLYSFMPLVMKKTSATWINLSLLTADLYSLLCGLFLFHYRFSCLYLLSFFIIILGLAVYSSASTYVVQDPRVYKQFRNTVDHRTSDPLQPSHRVSEPSVAYTSLSPESGEELI
ncbi:solute carrier family 35 member F1-like [Phycodurus eques]|uniref:solute carrier family 35 member F1-like n=1 Tax=Phycodurus eques TaxID=693459 RepID=UPI002ACD8716|nr:solute carrier family 35 member F1-like [Phycodurus eques]